MKKLGLIGFPLGHSFSKKYYQDKFEKEAIQAVDYDLYTLENIADFPNLLAKNPEFYGINVTIPHKQGIMHYLDALSAEALEIQAVNCVQIRNKEGKTYLKGFNTDAYGFENSLKPLLQKQHCKALVFGNGGAAKAVLYVLKKLGIAYHIVSRSLENGDLTYDQLTAELIEAHTLLINCSPLGTFPNIEHAPNIPYAAIGSDHLLYDLIYNPEETLFLKKGKEKGATTKNGYEMLLLQAEKNWEIWHAD